MTKNLNPNPSSIEAKRKIIQLFRASQRCFRDYLSQKSKEYGFTAQQIQVIFTLYQNPDMNLQDLSLKMELSKSTVSVIVDRLVGQGVVARDIPAEDRRIVRLSLAPGFLEEFNISDAGHDIVSDLFKEASTEELFRIIGGLETFLEYINNKDR